MHIFGHPLAQVFGGMGFGAGAGGSAAPFVPSSITGLVRWFETGKSLIYEDDAATTPATDGSVVGYWQDLSASAEHALQATAGSKPLYRTALAPLGACVDFVSSDMLDWTTNLQLADFDAFFTVAIDSFAAARPLIGHSTAADRLSLTSDILFSANIGGQAGSAPITLSAATKYVLHLSRTTSAVNFYVNNVLQGAATVAFAANTFNRIGMRAAAVNVMDGQMSKILIYSAELSSADRLKVYNYMAA